MPASELPRPTTYQFITWRICVYSASGLRSTSAFRMYVSVNFVCLQRKCGCLRRMASCLSELGMRLSQNNSFLCQVRSTSLRGLSACFRKSFLLPQREPTMINPKKTVVYSASQPIKDQVSNKNVNRLCKSACSFQEVCKKDCKY